MEVKSWLKKLGIAYSERVREKEKEREKRRRERQERNTKVG